jgi:hypothetical protein
MLSNNPQLFWCAMSFAGAFVPILFISDFWTGLAVAVLWSVFCSGMGLYAVGIL